MSTASGLCYSRHTRNLSKWASHCKMHTWSSRWCATSWCIVHCTKYICHSIGCNDCNNKNIIVPSNPTPNHTANSWRVQAILLYWKINPTSDWSIEHSTIAFLLYSRVKPLQCFHSLFEILLSFYFSKFKSFYFIKFGSSYITLLYPLHFSNTS